MTTPRSTRSLPVRLTALFGAVALVTTAAVIGVSPPTEAHNVVVSSVPAEGEVLTALPDQFVVTTNAALLKDVGAMQVTGPDGLFYGDGCVLVDGPSLTMDPALGDAGDYSLVWQGVSEDVHTISGAIAFSWQPAAATEASEGWDTAPVCGEERPTQQEGEPAASESPVASEEPGDPVAAEEPADLTAVWVIGGILLAALLGTAGYLLLRRPRTPPAA